MKFTSKTRRQAPTIIIISLIDILIVILIFLMVTTTFKQQPAVQITLPESKQPKQGATDASIVVTVAKKEPFLYIETRPVTLAKLQQELNVRAAQNPNIGIAIRGDAESPWKQIINVMEAAKTAKIKTVKAFIKSSSQ